ncbi:MAG: LPXTG cell wall anchor domain-containing protein [Candidatus Microbacterium stercoravium]|uniref:LPXTG cell wall anchor domain-containing protein n=1 Tax=Candidatus Microbacterium stercoravium TaxID=2838697 RepID=A0A9D2KHK9_9MICO|nr:LPXTG cell wall anchor domain-containing protein [Candidatus Microbacterium stercoravium]
MSTLSFSAQTAELAQTGGDVTGIVIVIAAVLIIAGAVLFFAMRARSKRDD